VRSLWLRPDPFFLASTRRRRGYLLGRMSSFVLPLEAASIADCSIIVVLSARRICSYLSLSDNPVIEHDIRAPAVQFMYLKGRCRFVRNVQAVAITWASEKTWYSIYHFSLVHGSLN